ncbi:phosphoribosylglycinamide formyltransferase-1 [Cognatiyoonia koreensis]|uniref:Phosphoribosylglycinamide formyltransferase n=1 Tax=Cognatiyoonia koreensis TaxID=364200 RepID=A0A1I0PEH1_9RHOB|nr:phosphoribosylglycinamide formyltransferase [Cognatiyoonia koreensis]SEW12684.1 phosphoribosylglycinamide formyltransferase-1 [Cognatiyoonia koreensis]
MTKRVAILISGSGSNMVSLVAAMTGDFPARPVLVLSNKAEAAGLRKAEALGVPTVTVAHRDYPNDKPAFERAMHHALLAAQPDVICLAGFMRVLSAEFVSAWSGKILNIHPSLLPKYKGLNTHARALAAGDTVHGCTVHEVTADLDDGPILGQASIDVRDNDTPETLAARLLPYEHELYPRVLRRFADGDRTLMML